MTPPEPPAAAPPPAPLPSPSEPRPSLGARLRGLRTRYQELVLEYGRLAIAVYVVIFATSITGFWLAIRLGLRAAGGQGSMWAMLGSAYVAARVLFPARLAATLVLTPLVERVLRAWPRLHRLLTGARSQGPSSSGEAR